MNLPGAIRKSFRVKIMLISIFFMLVACFALTGFFVHYQSVSLNDALIERGRLLARVLSHSAKVGIFSENRDLLRDPVDGTAEQQEVLGVSVFNAEGVLLCSSLKFQAESVVMDEKIGSELKERLGSSNIPTYESGPASIKVWSAVWSAPGYAKTESLFFKGAEFQKAPDVIGFINIELSREILKERLYGFLSTAVIMAIMATTIGSLLIFLVVKGITSPLNRLALGIRALGADGVAETVPADTEDEIGRLAAAFNELSESLRKKKAENYQLEMQLRQAQKLEALGTLAGGIAHDFNNVLSPIFGYTEMAMEDLSDNQALCSNLKQVLHAATRARELVRQILAFSRQNETQRTPIRMQVILKEALKLMRASLPTTIRITEQIDQGCGPVLADPTNIHQIVMNLCTNASYAMKEQGGELKVVLEEEPVERNSCASAPDLESGRYVVLCVGDTGVGMDDATLQRIFDPYFTTKPVGEGTGMGLAMVHGIAKGCGGAIRVESAPGKGTLFRIYFPRVEIDSASTDTIPVQSIQRGNEHVLLVDDEAQIAFMLKQMLEHLGYQVTVRTSSLEALEAFSAKPDYFDIVITDQTMPNMTGDILAAEVMRLRGDIPVILCTGFSEKITEVRAREKGIRALLTKPVLKQELAAAIRDALAGKM